MFDKLKKLFGGQAGAWSSYEGASHSNRRRMVPGSSPTDNHHELNSSTRSQLVKASRYVSKNSGVAKEVITSNQLYAVGDGIRVKPQGGSATWKRRAVQYWEDWSQNCTICGRFNFVEVQRMVSRLIDEDGECFVLKTNDGRDPKIQIIESHRVGNWKADSDDYIDGIKFDRLGRPKLYCYMDNSGNIRDLKADSVLHVFDPERPSTARSAPTLSHCTNHLRDAMELLALEKHAVKQSADVVHILNTESASSDDAEFMPVQTLGDGTDPATLQRITGGKVVSTQGGEELSSFESKRPNSTFTGFLDYLDRDTTLGVLPYEFVVDPSKPTGAGVRLVVAKADRRFQWRSRLISTRLIEPLWFFVIGSAVEAGKLTGPSGWWRVKTGTPRRVTVDAGRERREDREDVMAGLKNLGDHFDEHGKDFVEEVEQRAAELAHIEEIAAKYGVDPGKVLSLLTAEPDQDINAGDNDQNNSKGS
ncbi:MAG: phage portal protein [Myxococcales bacterium]|nr:phage portal protein [Myxococcales bacterium]